MAHASQKSVNKENEKNRPVPSYKLEVIFDPKGLQINQTPDNVSPFDVIAVLDIVKSMHMKGFLDNTTPHSVQDERVPLTPEQQRAIDESMKKTFGKNLDGKGGTFKPDITPIVQDMDDDDE